RGDEDEYGADFEFEPGGQALDGQSGHTSFMGAMVYERMISDREFESTDIRKQYRSLSAVAPVPLVPLSTLQGQASHSRVKEVM
ncbi:hypothetical protein N0V84_003774, partial [Fusarium piperis]